MKRARAISALPPPIALLAELTHRCPQRCPYCSNPMDLTRRSAEMPAADWARVLKQAAALGVLQVHFSGGEPAARGDLPTLVAFASRADVYTNLITSGLGLQAPVLKACVAAGLDHVQLSVQGPDAGADRISGIDRAFQIKEKVVGWIDQAGLPLTLNAVVHRQNLDRLDEIIDLAVDWRARRLEIAHVQYHGWALANRAALMPTPEQITAAAQLVTERRQALMGVLAIDYVPPDHASQYPKSCMGGWGQNGIVVTPEGTVLPCHAARTLPNLTFQTVHEAGLDEIWRDGAAFNAYRGIDWMQEPCRSCDRRTKDWGGCRCQAFALTGDAAATDPTCSLSPHHGRLRALIGREVAEAETGLTYRGF